ncbi:putative TatD related DNase [Leishmania naiffi]|uniref:TatD related DNase n=1 Tax=Leishmania naiffi TaxID=5678 RepID=A0AAW3CA70_9TRYP
MGFVDRGGGREAKGSSLRRSKKNPGAPTTKNKSASKSYTTPTTRSTPMPPPVCLPVLKALIAPTASEGTAAASTVAGYEKALAAVHAAAQAGGSLHIDAAVALLSRKLKEDQEGIFRRAVEEGKLAAMVCWCGEVERQSLLLDTCAQHNKLYRGALEQQQEQYSTTGSDVRHVHFKDDYTAPPGAVVASITTEAMASPSSAKAGVTLYAVLGIHVNNIDRLNIQLHGQWVKELERNVKHSDVVGVLTGLNLSRDHGTHYAQERLFKECWRVAAEVHLPLVLHLYAVDAASLTETVDRAAKLLDELLATALAVTDEDDAAGAAPSAVVLYDALRVLHASTAMRKLLRAHRPAAETTAAVAAVPFYALVTADGLALTKTEDGEAEVTRAAESGPSAEALAALLPPRAQIASSAAVHLSQLLIGTGAPWGTPQNLPDPHLRTLPNEPGNYTYVLQTLYDTMQAPTAVAALTLADLSAIVVVNHLRVFFHECILAPQPQQSSSDDTTTTDAAQQQQQQQRQWAESQQPGAVAGLENSDAKRDLEALLVEAAKERERLVRERLREEEAREQARSEELQEKRSKREKKKNVKANNRSNFTHFRNKNFAPRQSQQERLTPLREAGSREESDAEVDGKDDAREKALSSTSASSESDGAAGPSSLAAEVERLLQANAAHCDQKSVAQRQPAEGAKGKGKKALPGSGKAHSTANSKEGQQHDAGASGNVENESLDNSSDTGEAQDPTRPTMAKAKMQISRRQRKRQQKRQQQHRGDDSSDDDA